MLIPSISQGAIDDVVLLAAAPAPRFSAAASPVRREIDALLLHGLAQGQLHGSGNLFFVLFNPLVFYQSMSAYPDTLYALSFLWSLYLSLQGHDKYPAVEIALPLDHPSLHDWDD